MDHRAKLVILGSCLFSSSSFAFYVDATAPSSWRAIAGVPSVQISQADISFANGIRSKTTAAAVNVGGKSVAMDVAYKFAPSAGRLVSAGAFLNPALFLASGAYLAYQWYTENSNLEVIGNMWVKVTTGEAWEWEGAGVYHPSPSAACEAVRSYYAGQQPAGYQVVVTNVTYVTPPANSQCTIDVISSGGSHSPMGFGLTPRAKTPSSTVTPATQADVENAVAGKAVPVGVPQAWPVPNTWWPVLNPILNPSVDAIPVSQPMRLPQGSPQPVVPATDPATYKSPVVDITPYPSTSNPWQVDIVSKDVVSVDPNPLPETAPVPVTPDPGTTESPKETAPGLCDQYPSIIACKTAFPNLCQENPGILACKSELPKFCETNPTHNSCKDLGTLTPEAIPNQNVPLAILKDTGWGPTTGVCPAPKTALIMGVSLSMPYTMLCDFALAINPLLIAFAWLSAAMTFFGMSRKD